MSKWNLIFLVSLVVMTFSFNASAGDFQFRFGYGKAEAPNTDDMPYPYNYSVEKANTFFFDFGYSINQYISIDLRYANLADLQDMDSSSDYFVHDYYVLDGVQDQTAELNIQSLGLAATITTDSTRPYYAGLKLGYHYSDTEWHQKIHSFGTRLELDYVSQDVLSESEYDWTRQDNIEGSGFNENYGAIVGINISNWQIGLEHMLYALKNGDSQATTLFIGKKF
ncbi:hypothetical protein [Microbulbifer agarilyticus]